MTQAFVFPGQGSQAVGMGRALKEAFPAAAAVFAEVDEALSQKLSTILFEGPEDALTLTENAQPAIMACGIAALRVMQKETGLDVTTAVCVAGHSLGEYTALCAAGAISLAECAKLLRIRGNAMQQAVPAGDGAMAAILGLEIAPVRAIVEGIVQNGGLLDIANHNGTQQIVISGKLDAVNRAMELAKEKGAKRAVPLSVSAPFHCRLMEPAARKMEEALAMVTIKAPLVPLVANVTAQETQDPEAIRRLLVQQVTGMVRWVESVERMSALGATQFIELGHGNVLAGLIKRIAPEATTISVGGPEEMEKFARAA
jgi:[acyl-carrier-protein] S-malonyltransferase